MEADGLLTAKVAARGKHAQKRLYSVTRKGLDELRRWAGAPVTYPPSRDPALLKVSYLDVADLAEAQALFEAHIAHHTERLRLAEDRLKVLQAGRTRRQSIQASQEREAMLAFRALVLEGQVTTANTEIQWGRRGLDITARLEQSKRRRSTPARSTKTSPSRKAH